MSFAEKYCLLTMGIGAFQKTFQTWEGKLDRQVFDQKTKSYVTTRTNMLMGEKMSIVLIGTLTGPIRFPFVLVNWINYIDIYFKGHCMADYGLANPKRKFRDYLS